VQEVLVLQELVMLQEGEGGAAVVGEEVGAAAELVLVLPEELVLGQGHEAELVLLLQEGEEGGHGQSALQGQHVWLWAPHPGLPAAPPLLSAQHLRHLGEHLVLPRQCAGGG